MPDLDPGREEELRRLRRWLAFSERLDRLIEVAEHPLATNVSRRWDRLQPVFNSSRVAPEPLRAARARARLAAALARTAVALNREAAAGAIARSPLEGQPEGRA